MRVVMVKGFSKTGKTTTVTLLTEELRRRGYSVGTIKDIHYEGYRADTPGTDTDKHRCNGSGSGRHGDNHGFQYEARGGAQIL